MSKIYEINSKQSHRIRRIFTTDIEYNGITPAHSVGTIVASFDGQLRGDHIVASNSEDLLKMIEDRIIQGGVLEFSLVEVPPVDFSDLYLLIDQTIQDTSQQVQD